MFNGIGMKINFNIYKIVLRSYFDSNADGVGDLNGLRNKLGYLAHLGIDAIQIIFDHRLQFEADQHMLVPTFLKENPIYGTVDDFEALMHVSDQQNLDVFFSAPKAIHRLFSAGWKPAAILHAIQQWGNNPGADVLPFWSLCDERSSRAASRLGHGSSDRRLKAAATIQFSMSGTPVIYYGDEIGMRDTPRPWFPPFQRPRTKGYFGSTAFESYCAPMQWDETPFSGFTVGQPWHAVNSDYTFRNVATQRRDAHSLLAFYQRLIRLRHDMPVLRDGVLLPLTYEPQTLLAYLRQLDGQHAMVVINFSRRANRFVLGSELARTNWRLLISSADIEEADIRGRIIWLAPEEACILLQHDD